MEEEGSTLICCLLLRLLRTSEYALPSHSSGAGLLVCCAGGEDEEEDEEVLAGRGALENRVPPPPARPPSRPPRSRGALNIGGVLGCGGRQARALRGEGVWEASPAVGEKGESAARGLGKKLVGGVMFGPGRRKAGLRWLLLLVPSAASAPGGARGGGAPNNWRGRGCFFGLLRGDLAGLGGYSGSISDDEESSLGLFW